ncbi:MAG: hypothetical protein IRY97_12100, partial [Thermomicrobiaceae bacterium]|nr:hypothetical protein [Thermomicrobiaceae bacterium]
HWEPLPPDYDWDEGIRLGALPQIVLMRHEPLELALVSAGRGAIRPEPQLVHVAMQVPPDTLRRLRAQALVRSHPVLADRPHEFVFRDPFGIVWHLSDVAAAAPAALGAGGGPAQERGTATP